MLEVEVKARIIREVVQQKLLAIGAHLVKKEKQVDTYFNHPCRDFKARDEALRVRKARKNVYLAYKGPKIDPETKTRKEVEVKVEEGIFALLESLGFTPLKRVIKKRELYHWQGLKICVDEVENLGSFLEIEGKDEREKDKIFQLLNKLNISRSSLTRKSYLEVIMEKDKKNPSQKK